MAREEGISRFITAMMAGNLKSAKAAAEHCLRMGIESETLIIRLDDARRVQLSLLDNTGDN